MLALLLVLLLTALFTRQLSRQLPCGLRVTDRVSAETQNVVDEANDVVAEARRESKIDAAVRARLAELEEGIRAEVTKQVDAEGAQA